MSGSIYIEPNKVDENADEIVKLGKKMLSQMEEVNSRVKSLRADWQDDVQVDYEAEFAKLKGSFESFAEVIPSYAAEAHAHAESMRRIGHSS